MPSCNIILPISNNKAPHAILPEETEEEVADRMFNNISCSLNALMSCVGDSLGVYKALQDVGPCSPSSLAKRLGLSERWVQEWLYQQVSSRMPYQNSWCACFCWSLLDMQKA